MTLEIEGSNELAIYVKRISGMIVYTHAGKLLALNPKDLNVKT